MSAYVGIDLGTTNSAICVFDGEEVVLFKSPEQTDVTPSVIYFGPRGNRFVGTRAYNYAAKEPERTATQFKRLMGTSTPIALPAAGLVWTPVQCSTEILKTLFGYLPEAVRSDPNTGTVITVPAAFDQMQKDATLQAATAAGIGKVALMQEPVAAVMSVMRKRKGDGIFLIYDIGGGTLDIAIAQSVGGRVSLLGQGGIPMCGGRDFDLLLVNNIVVPWLSETFALPDGFAGVPEYRRLTRMAEYAAEQAKISLSSRPDAIISASEHDLSTKDAAGTEIYIDCAVTREQLGELIADKVEDSVQAAREAVEKAGLSVHDIERVVFVGGPSQYKPLRDKVTQDLGISASTDLNPMTAVAEGAAVFAESIDWSVQNRARKSARGFLTPDGGLDLSFSFVARTPDSKAKLVLKVSGTVLKGSEFQIDSLETGWSTGRGEIRNGASVELPLNKPGENVFKIFVFDPSGGPINLRQDRIAITRTAATIDAIPASHSIAIEVRDRIGGSSMLDFLVRAGDQLPKRGRHKYKAGESVRAGSPSSLNFNIYEGDIENPISHNRFIGLFKISGDDFVDGVIPAGTDLMMDFEITDSGNIILDVSVPLIGANFHSGKNFYSRKEAEVDYTNAAMRVREDAEKISAQLADMSRQVDDPLVSAARDKLEGANVLSPSESNPETTKQAMDDVQRAKALLAKARKANLKVMRRMELGRVVNDFDQLARKFAKPSEVSAFEALVKTAEAAIGRPAADFESYLRDLRGKIFGVLNRQDWFVADRFSWYSTSPHLFANPEVHGKLVSDGKRAQQNGDIDGLRKVVFEMDMNRISTPDADDLLAVSNIVRG
jgi:molecular chaperone DnaK